MKTYTITFDSNGGPYISPVELEYDAPISLSPPPRWTGHTFERWNPEPPARMPDHDLELKAIWLENTLTVSFNPMGGIPTPASIVVTEGLQYGSLPVVTKEGYALLGWYTSETGGNLITEGDVVTNDESHTLYARWISQNIPVTGIQILDTDEVYKREINRELPEENTPRTITLETRFIPENATNKNVTWSSNNGYLATVNSNGIVTINADRTGNVTITVRTQDGNHTASLNLVVTTDDDGGCGW